MEYYVTHHGDKFYALTNENAKNFKWMEVLVQNPAKKYWTELIPHRKTVKIDRVEAFKNH